ncbi:phosphopantothenoylcysteine decarboxylase-like protein [Dinothrombium tinctorium]|uniref:Phosphopantothenoylcysteine decarboxylase n=1 Tax=Dinothrombium tinctorium TaxID=1965070 RepID=A0A3S3S1P7_9ACAR|nr:phosphopantothenoylcysteine decarboxylase-like protein [Dinothrombium tinctorium]RWS08699.1 phosphopantothenoylcysteine decarboxylase-like protein [Dinothrombium tinctorium]
MPRKLNVLIGVTGSVAAIKLPILVEKLQRLKSDNFDTVEIQVIVTRNAMHFFDRDQVLKLGVRLITDEDEWKAWEQMSDPVLHIELRKWANLMVIAPLDANTMAKIGCGMCDNLLTCVVRAWDFAKPLLFCPAMNTYMWEHPLTIETCSKLESLGFEQIPVIAKKLACGDTGYGAMAEVDSIVERIKQKLCLL